MEFVNVIAHLVHGAVAARGGAANKNIGDAFLLVRREGVVLGLMCKSCRLVKHLITGARSGGCKGRGSQQEHRNRTPAGATQMDGGLRHDGG
jgi:hypothetical protein